MKNVVLLIFALTIGFVINANCQVVSSLIVEIKTGDKRFAGTDDATYIGIGGKSFRLDNPNKDDFERNNIDLFTFEINDPQFTIELIRAVGVIRIEKTEDSFWGGGWYFAKLTVWLNNQTSAPIYTNESINKWLDGSDRSWGTSLGDSGWNLPESPPFPPCYVKDTVVYAASTTRPVSYNSKIDSDCDGIPDEIDPNFDTDVPDSDGDGLPDRYENQIGLNPDSNDSDEDGWLDNKNIKDILILTEVECIDEDGRGYLGGELGSDEIYLNVEDVRFPLSSTLDNYWELDDDTSFNPYTIIDERVSSGQQIQPIEYKSRIRLREADIQILKKPTDDTFKSFILEWGRNQTMELEFNEDGAHYKLHFMSTTINFKDIQRINDSDGDGISDELEYKIATQSPDLRPNNESEITGYNGISDPLKKNLFIEVDATSSDDKMPFEAKQQVVSQFYNHNILIKLDDGFLGGGEILPYKKTVEFDELTDYMNDNQWTERNNHYKYALYVPKKDKGPRFGQAIKPGKNFMITKSTMVGSLSSIVFMHELGHTMGLCHPINTKEQTSTTDSECPRKPCTVCDHYGKIDDDAVTAMGNDIGIEDIVIGAAIGFVIGIIIAYAFTITGWGAIGVLLGSSFLGAIGGLFFSDAYMRLVDYHPNEWAALFFEVF